MMYYTYILRCKDNSLYTGITTDIKRRMEEHFSKGEKCAKYTRTHSPVKLEAAWQSENKAAASRLEYHIKRLNKAQKEKIIADNDLSILKDKINTETYTRVTHRAEQSSAI